MRILPFLLAFLFLTAACGEGSLVAVHPEPEPTTPTQPEQPEQETRYQLEITTFQPLTIVPGGTQPLAVRLFENGVGMADQEIRFRIDADAGGARVATLRTRTDAQGRGQVDVIAGSEAAEFEVIVESDHTEAVHAAIMVLPAELAPAALRVRAAYPALAQQPIERVAVSIHDGNELCADLEDAVQPTAYDRGEMDLTASLRFDGYAHDEQVTILAIGHNAVAGVAAGCVEGVILTGGEETEVEVRLDPREIDPRGTYDFATTLDTRGAIPGTAGTVIETIAAMFEHPDDPARFLVNLLEEQSGFSFGFMRQTAIDYLDGLIRSIVPERFLRLFEYVSDAARVVTRMSLEGTLRIYEDLDGYLVAEERWETVIFDWRGGCDPQAQPGCNEHRVALRHTHIGEIVAEYDVAVDGQVLRIGSHDRAIQYARFFHLFILEIVYPHIVAGASSTGELLNGVIDCTAVALMLDDADGTSDGYLDIGIARISVDDLEGFCIGGLGTVGSLVDGYLDQLASGAYSVLTLAGAAQMVDEVPNLKPERLSNGVWDGTIGVDGTDHTARGTFSAERRLSGGSL
jgi:hypothetical protein